MKKKTKKQRKGLRISIHGSGIDIDLDTGIDGARELAAIINSAADAMAQAVKNAMMGAGIVPRAFDEERAS